MAEKHPRRLPAEAVATRDEVDQAIESLTPANLLKLNKFAAWRIRGLGRASLGRTHKDLLGEAMTSTLAGGDGTAEGRRWNKNVDFVRHLSVAMRSISDHWKTRFDEQEAHLESELVTVDPDGQEISPLDNVRSRDPAADRLLIAKEEVGRILKMFEGDDDAILVLEGWVEGMTGPEIMELGFTKQRYEAAVKRIRYTVRDRVRGGEERAG